MDQRSGKKSGAKRELAGYPLFLSQYTEAHRNHVQCNAMEVNEHTHTHTHTH